MSDAVATMVAMAIGALHGIVIDSPDPASLASFYEDLLGMVRVQDEGDWVVIGDAADRPGLAFARAERFQPPSWPTDPRPQFYHFDVRVADLDEAAREVIELGATRLPGGGETFRVFADPAGHPFCRITV